VILSGIVFFVMCLRMVFPAADGKYLSLSIAETRQNSVINYWRKKDFMICNVVIHTYVRHSYVLFYLDVAAGTCLQVEKCSGVLEFRHRQVLLYFVFCYVSDEEVRNVDCYIVRSCVLYTLDLYCCFN
jgi:hypothetical protein